LASPRFLQQPCNEKPGSKAKTIFIYYLVLQFLSSLMELQSNPTPQAFPSRFSPTDPAEEKPPGFT